MILLEIAAQGVRGFAPERGRISLRPGYNVVAGDGATLRRLVVALLHPAAPADPALRADATGGAVRGGVTLTGDDGVTWRVVRDMSGPCQLQRYDPEKQAFRSVQQDPARITEVLRAAGVPGPERLEFVLGIAAADFPSRQGPGQTPFAAATAAPARRISSSPVDARRKLEAARAELVHARETEDLQGKLDALQSRLFKLEEMLKSGEQVNERLRVAQARVASFAEAEAALSALGDAVARLAAAAKAGVRRDEALARIAAEREAQGGAGKGNRWPLARTPGFLAGVGVGAVALLGGLVTEARTIALAAIPATGWAAFEGLRWVGRAEESEQAGRRSRVLADRERKIAEAWERETGDVRAAMKAVGAANLAELDDLRGRAQEARAALSEAEAGYAAWRSLAETQDAETERAAVQQEIGAVEAQITTGSGGFVRDVGSLEAEILRLEREVETGPFGPMVEAVEPVAEPAPARGGEPLRTLMERATRELGLTPGAALRAIQQRVVQLLPVLSGQRLSNFFVDERGNLQVQAMGKLVPVATLGTPERDVCFAVLKVAFLEQGLAAGKAVGVVDDAFASLHEGSRRVLARVLKQLARGRQVVHGTSDVVFREAADHAA